MGHPRQTATCCICGATFEGSVWYALVSRYCSAACRNIGNKQTISTARRGETAAIVPSETKPARTKPMTDAEFERELALIRRQLTERGIPLTRLDGIAVQEKPERIAAAQRRKAVAA